MNNINVLVTGGAGFAGSYVTEYLVKKGYIVTATYRNKRPGNPLSEVKYIQLDLSLPICIEDEFDAIVHTAVSASGRALPAADYIRDNIDTARNLIDFARKKEIGTIVYFSTRSIYGEVRVPYVVEDTDIINPDLYGMTKCLAEKIFYEAEGINTLGIRLPGVIGPGAHDIWLTDIADRIKKGEDVTVSDFNTKNLAWLGDISDFIDLQIKKSLSGKIFKYPVVNVACSESINNYDIVLKLKEAFNSKSQIALKKPSPGLFLLDNTKALEMGFVPSSPMNIVDMYIDTLME